MNKGDLEFDYTIKGVQFETETYVSVSMRGLWLPNADGVNVAMLVVERDGGPEFPLMLHESAPHVTGVDWRVRAGGVK